MVYTNSPLVDYTRISPNSTNPRKSKIKKITIHHMAGNLSVEACGNVFANPSRKASANYGIGTDGRVGLYVEEKNRAWTSSNAENDNQAVTIEVANDITGGDWHVSDKALEKLIELCVDICKRNEIESLNFTGDKNGNLTMHRYFAATACPGEYLASKFPYIANEVNKRLDKIIPTTHTTPTYTHTDFVKEVQAAIGAKIDGIAGNETFGLVKNLLVSKTKNNKHTVVKPIQKYLNSLGYDCGTPDSIFGVKTHNAVILWQKNNGLTKDGIIGEKSWKILLK